MQLEWAVVPSRETLLELCARIPRSKPAGQRAGIPESIEGLTRDEQEARLLELSETGRVGSHHACQAAYGYDLTQAKAFVDGFAMEGAAPARKKKPEALPATAGDYDDQ